MLFNTKEYEWSDVTVILAGRMIVGFRGVAYTSSQEKEMLYGKGNKPHSMQTGNKSYSGTVTLTQSELEALEKAAGGDALDASFNMIVSYGNPSRGDAIKTDLIKGGLDNRDTQGDAAERQVHGVRPAVHRTGHQERLRLNNI